MRHITPPARIYCGTDCLQYLAGELERLNSHRAVIFCGRTLSRSPLLDRIRSAASGRCTGVFAGVLAHSPHPSIEAAAAELKRLEADAIIAVGGGSAVVSARAASIYLAEGTDLVALSTHRDARGTLHSPKLAAPKIPQLIVPTTPNTATVKAGTAVFEPVSSRRYALFDPKTRAQSLFILPEMLMSTPRELTITSCFDTLALAIEGITSKQGDSISDALLMHAIRLLARSLPDPDLGEDARCELMFAAILGGQGTDYTGAGVATVLGHAIGANHAIENGLAKAVLLPHTVRFNADWSRSGMAKLATALDVPVGRRDSMEASVEALVTIFARIGVPTRLRDIGLPREALPAIAARGMEDWFLTTNPRPVSEASELLGILEDAW